MASFTSAWGVLAILLYLGLVLLVFLTIPVPEKLEHSMNGLRTYVFQTFCGFNVCKALSPEWRLRFVDLMLGVCVFLSLFEMTWMRQVRYKSADCFLSGFLSWESRLKFLEEECMLKVICGLTCGDSGSNETGGSAFSA